MSESGGGEWRRKVEGGRRSGSKVEWEGKRKREQWVRRGGREGRDQPRTIGAPDEEDGSIPNRDKARSNLISTEDVAATQDGSQGVLSAVRGDEELVLTWQC